MSTARIARSLRAYDCARPLVVNGPGRDMNEPPTDALKIHMLVHAAPGARGGVVMCGGARGGTRGPAGIYEPLAVRLQQAGVTSIRLDYRWPNRLAVCVHDVMTVINNLEQQGVERVVLIGWSFGGAVVIGAGMASERVVGVATIASQTSGADMVAELAPRSLLLLHGTADETLSDVCSRVLFSAAGDPKELVLYPDDNHGLTHHAADVLEKLYAWSVAML